MIVTECVQDKNESNNKTCIADIIYTAVHKHQQQFVTLSMHRNSCARLAETLNTFKANNCTITTRALLLLLYYCNYCTISIILCLCLSFIKSSRMCFVIAFSFILNKTLQIQLEL